MAKESTRSRLCESFRELAQNNSIERITIRQISENCGLTSQTFYNNFNDKLDMILWAYKKNINALLDSYEKGDITWVDCLTHVVNEYDERGELILKLSQSVRTGEVYAQQFVTCLCEAAERVYCHKMNLDRVPEHASALIKIYAIGCVGATLLWLEGGKRIDKEEFVGILDQFVPYELRADFLGE